MCRPTEKGRISPVDKTYRIRAKREFREEEM